ncbi:septum formation inhibitor [Pelotomaculum thermopropionicum SI]|uniref:Probable septum site-determining protein MinC n=1 Tax=Pelotomaculum thermopropionicum (strain DSM 13744 / JCM 10971 / SI) TaxID=370438 RepID=MINC_PELTS|nr:RecName: Full=Probable septum site-determining protein MinC [Pelotomaculum thermopropionicum SI]BAF59511.1 septum formation inhibitor [Pelotomaculum thermopropionicum SI]
MSREMISIKGTRNGLVFFLDPTREFEEIKNTLLSKMESARGFFKGAKFSISHGQKDMPVEQKNELVNICRRYGLIPNNDDAAVPANAVSKASPRATRAASNSKPTIGENALMVRRSLRSGQCISYPGHVVVIGDVHPGAEVISGGNVLVMGSCRGLIHAGAGGNLMAKVVALRLAPTVLSIAGQRYAPEHPSAIPPGCQVARLSGQEIIFEKFQAAR